MWHSPKIYFVLPHRGQKGRIIMTTLKIYEAIDTTIIAFKGVALERDNYKEVFNGQVEGENITPEQIFQTFQQLEDQDLPESYRGHSLSVGDVIELGDKLYRVEVQGFTTVEWYVPIEDLIKEVKAEEESSSSFSFRATLAAPMAAGAAACYVAGEALAKATKLVAGDDYDKVVFHNFIESHTTGLFDDMWKELEEEE